METWLDFVGFGALVFGTSIISGIVGMLGGIVLLAAMGAWFPPEVLIPLHGCIQILSNGSRFVLLRRDVKWNQLAWFAPGAVAAAVLAVFWLPSVPGALLSRIVALSCVLLVWVPLLLAGGGPRIVLSKSGYTGLGAGITFLSFLVGAVGPLLDAFVVNSGLTKNELLGTKAGFQVLSHGLKIIVFGLAGFALAAWLPLLGLVLPLTVLGNRLGQAVLEKIPQKPFMLALRILVSALSVFMFANA